MSMQNNAELKNIVAIIISIIIVIPQLIGHQTKHKARRQAKAV